MVKEKSYKNSSILGLLLCPTKIFCIRTGKSLETRNMKFLFLLKCGGIKGEKTKAVVKLWTLVLARMKDWDGLIDMVWK